MKTKLIIILIILFAGLSTLPHLSRKEYQGVVTEKWIKRRSESSDKYLLSVTLSDGRRRVLENTDSFIEFKWNSSDVYASLEEGKEYSFKVYGWRIPFLSSYENILSAKKEK